MKESRLIGLRGSDFGYQNPLDAKTAYDALKRSGATGNPAPSATTTFTQVGEPSNQYEYYGNNVATNTFTSPTPLAIKPSTAMQMGQSAGMSDREVTVMHSLRDGPQMPAPGDPSTPGLNEARSAGFSSVGEYDQFKKTNLPATVLSDQKGLAGLEGRLKALDPRQYLKKDGSIDNAAFEEARQTEIARAEAEEKVMSGQKDRKLKIQEANVQAKGITETPGAKQPSASDDLLGVLKNMAVTNPGMADFIPAIQALMQQAGNSAGLDAEYQRQLGQLDEPDGVAESVAHSKNLLAEDKAQSNAILKEDRDIAVEAAELAKDMAQIQQKKFELQQHRSENLLRESNIEMEIRNRRVAASMGITADTNGLRWMQSEVRKGNEALAFLMQAGSLQEAEFALQTGKQYSLSVRQAVNAHESAQLSLDSEFRKSIAELDKEVSLSVKERRKEKNELNKWYWGEKNKKDEQAFGVLKEFTKTLMDQINEQKKKELDGLIDEGDAIDFGLKMQDRVNNLDEVKSFAKINTAYQALLAAKATYDLDPSTKGAYDTALIKLYEHIIEPTSVVRKEEFDSQLRSQGLTRGAIQGLKDAITGGQGLDQTQQAAIAAIAGSIFESARRTSLEAIQPNLAQLKRFNSRPGSNVRLDEVLTPKVIDALDIPVDEFEEAEEMLGHPQEELGEEVVSAPADFNSWVASTGSGQIVHGSPFHVGVDSGAIDIDGKIGDPIRPPVAGVVTAVNAKDTGGYGISLVVRDAEGKEHLFGHLNSVNVKVGQKVAPNMVIAEMGNTGKVIPGHGNDGSHLHYRVTIGGKPVAISQPAEVIPQAPTTSVASVFSVPTASAAEPEPMQPPVSTTGQTLRPGGLKPNVPVAMETLEILGAFRNVSTGEILYPTDPKDVKWYQSRPGNFQDLTQPQAPSAPPSQIAGGKKIDLLTKP